MIVRWLWRVRYCVGLCNWSGYVHVESGVAAGQFGWFWLVFIGMPHACGLSGLSLPVRTLRHPANGFERATKPPNPFLSKFFCCFQHHNNFPHYDQLFNSSTLNFLISPSLSSSTSHWRIEVHFTPIYKSFNISLSPRNTNFFFLIRHLSLRATGDQNKSPRLVVPVFSPLQQLQRLKRIVSHCCSNHGRQVHSRASSH